MYNQSNYEDAYLDWYLNFGGSEFAPEERGWAFYKLINDFSDDESACGWAGIDYEADDRQDDLEVARQIAYDRMDDIEFSKSIAWTYGG